MNWQRVLRLSIQSRADERVSSRFSPFPSRLLEANGSPHRAIPLCKRIPLASQQSLDEGPLESWLPLSFQMWSWLAFNHSPFQPAMDQGGETIAQFESCLSGIRGLPVASPEKIRKSGRHPARLRLFSAVGIYPYAHSSPTLLLAGLRTSKTTAATSRRIACLSCSSSWRISREYRGRPTPSMCDAKCGPCDARLRTTSRITPDAQGPNTPVQ
jgi:hypothetical protein